MRSAWVARGRAGVPLAVRVDASATARARAERVRAALDAWTGAVERDVEKDVASGRAGRLLDARGWASLVCAAAVGVGGAARAVERTLGAAGRAAWIAARDDLAVRAAEVVRSESDAFVAALDGLGIGSRPAEALRATARELEVIA